MGGKWELPTFKVTGSGIRKTVHGSVGPGATAAKTRGNEGVELNQSKSTVSSVGAPKKSEGAL